jgi:hypothetical protein
VQECFGHLLSQTQRERLKPFRQTRSAPAVITLGALTMACKRLNGVCPSAQVHWQANAMKQRPQLGVLIAYAIASWAYVEASLGNFLTLLLGSSAAPTIAVFMNSKMASQQINDVRAAAKAVLSERDFILANAVFNLASQAADQRNALAHSLWGYSDDVPDGIIAVSSVHFLNDNFKNAVGDQVAQRFDKPHKSEIWVYKEEDLIEIIEKIESLWSYIPMLVPLNTQDEDVRQQIWEQFRQFPEFMNLLPTPVT